MIAKCDSQDGFPLITALSLSAGRFHPLPKVPFNPKPLAADEPSLVDTLCTSLSPRAPALANRKPIGNSSASGRGGQGIRRRVMTLNWDNVEDEVRKLYVTEKRSLGNVRNYMECKYGFVAS